MINTVNKKNTGIQIEVDPEYEEKIELTEHNNLPNSMYMMLAHDENDDVRYSLASNANIPKQVLFTLLEDENVYVSHRAGKTIERIEREEVKARMSIVHYGPGVVSAPAGLVSA